MRAALRLPERTGDSAAAHASPAHLAFALVLAIGLSAASVLTIDRQTLGLFHDDGIYAVVAKSISQGTGSRIISLPMSPAQTKYPVVYSYLLASAWRLGPPFPGNILLLKGLNSVALLGIVLLAHRFFTTASGRSAPDALLYAFLLGASPALFSLTDYTLSDPVFLLLTLLGLLMAQRLSVPTSARVAGLAVVAGVACLTRTAGVALVGAGLLHLLRARRGRHLLLFAAIVAALAGPWMIWRSVNDTTIAAGSFLRYHVSYEQPAYVLLLSDPSGAARIIWGNLRLLVDSIDLLFMMPLAPWSRFAWYPLLALGGARVLRRQPLFVGAFTGLYVAVLLGYPFHPIRYLLPLIPVLLLSAFEGGRSLVSAATRRGGLLLQAPATATVVVLFAVLLATTLGWQKSYRAVREEATTRGYYGQRLPFAWSGFEETFAWIRERTRTEDIVATGYDPMYYLYTGRRAVRPWFHRPDTYFYPYGSATPDVGPVSRIKAELGALGVRYLVIDPMDGYAEKDAVGRMFTQLIASYGQAATLVFVSTDGKHTVYRLAAGTVS